MGSILIPLPVQSKPLPSWWKREAWPAHIIISISVSEWNRSLTPKAATRVETAAGGRTNQHSALVWLSLADYTHLINSSLMKKSTFAQSVVLPLSNQPHCPTAVKLLLHAALLALWSILFHYLWMLWYYKGYCCQLLALKTRSHEWTAVKNISKAVVESLDLLWEQRNAVGLFFP